jgi:hypothetical protein
MRNWCFIILCLIVFTNCVEQIDVVPQNVLNESFNGILIVEANITDVQKKQTVLLSRMQQVESDSTVNVEEARLFNANNGIPIPNGLQPVFERGAEVSVVDDKGNIFDFAENSPGKYESVSTFSALPETAYGLFVKTSDNQEYASEFVISQATSSINNVYAEREINDDGVEGMGIYVDASFVESDNKLLRYVFEETYKIIAPQWTAFEFEIIRDETEIIQDPVSGEVTEILYPDVRLVPREREERVCYKTDFSNQEILVNANKISSNSSKRNLVRFLGRDNPVISHRYSILIKQFLISSESFEFYERLKSFSSSESVFSQVQPGSLEGNVFDVDGNTNVIGYFDVSSEVSTRLYFNYEDIFPGESLPRYFGVIDCDRILSPPIPNPDRDGPPSPDGQCPFPLIDRIKQELVEHLGGNSEPPPICEGPYTVVNTICGDCNVVGSNLVPEFWIE